MKRIILTGGGTAGHVMPNLALVPELRRNGWEISYIGSYTGIERELVTEAEIPYYPIATGKFRRYFSMKNFTDPFRVVQGLGQAVALMRKLRPNIVFSKGGFVSVPVVIGAWLNRIPVILHESDLTPGLANRLSLPFATAICATFPETLAHLPAEKTHLTGNPIRAQLLQGSKEKGLKLCGFNSSKPVLAVLGGSLGSVTINEAIRAILPELLKRYQVVHICGKGNLDQRVDQPGYRQFEFVNEELPHLLAVADICVSRAGSNFIFELLALKKPALLIPLSKAASRGDQILNARSFAKQGFSAVLLEEELSKERLLSMINQLYQERQSYIAKMSESPLIDATATVIRLIDELAVPGKTGVNI
ncbi:MAG TPA: undecaprenyldiphospho-muramoylpentapeptide beta-N-acetylglucosaminyltransferase [Bacillota bacterium]|nr:undecaprenyldiphospho-muramoylpentapeptide beta-N-acetylglucosaminyltransferase [Bacillota bacterium]HPT88001.1 undecaprenyldiphospho-muramoylpentapeptide beta-N-acetylglucosaminyltransferase [Bacillota bacterium]